MDKQKPAKDPGAKVPPPEQRGDDFHPKPEPDGKNDSGPDPEIHGREIPPQ